MSASKLSTKRSAAKGWCLLGLALVVLAGCGSSPAPTAPGQGQAADQAATKNAEADTKALDSIGNRSWYDRSKREYRTPSPKRAVDHPLRQSGTVAGPSAPAAGPAAGGGRGWSWPSGEAIGYIIIITLGVALVGVAILLTFSSLRSWLPGRRLNSLQKAIAIDPARVADLPFEAQSEMQDPLAYAQHLIAQGKLDEAIIFIYGYMLLALDRAGKIVLHRGKTNRMYLHELVGEVELRGVLTPAMLAFEDVFFGRHSIEPERFRKIWGQLDYFHRTLAPSIAAAKPLEEGVTL